MTCDRIVCGIKDDNLRNRLLQTPNLILEQCIQTCRLSENKSAQITVNNKFEEQVDTIETSVRQTSYGQFNQSKHYSTASLQKCFNCGYSHGRRNCPAKEKECAGCHKIGHFIKVCRSQQQCRTRHVSECNVESCHVNPHNVATQQVQENVDDVDLFVGVIYNTEDTLSSLWYTNIHIGSGHWIRGQYNPHRRTQDDVWCDVKNHRDVT